MRIFERAALAVLFTVPLIGFAQGEHQDADSGTDEIVVVGRSVSTSTSRVEVEREILVDTAVALKDIPGANVNSNGALTGIAQYRGMYGDRVAVDIDQLGMVTGGPNAMDTPLSYMSPMMTEELVVARGVASVSLAPETIGGHISTTTSRGSFGTSDFGVSGVLGTRFADNGDISTSAARLTLADEHHRLSAVTEIDSGSDIKTPEGEIRPSGLSRKRYDLSYAYDDSEKSFTVYAGKLDTENTGTPALPMDIIFINTVLFGTQFAVQIDPNLLVEGRFSYSDVDHVMDDYSFRQAPMPTMYRVNNAEGSGSQFYLAGTSGRGGSKLVFGIDGIAARHDSVITNPNNEMFQVVNFTDVERDLLGVFVEWTRDVDNGEVEIGLRYNRVDTDAATVGATGMMGMMGVNVALLAADFNAADRALSWNSLDGVIKYRRLLAGDAEWSVEVGHKSRAPSYQELYLWLPMEATGGLADGKTYIGNLNLREEHSTELVAGMSADTGRWSVSPQVFYKRVNDYIQGVPSTNMTANMVAVMMSGSPPLQFANVDAELWGFDAAWSHTLSERLLLDGVVTAVRGRRTDVGDDLYRLSPFNASVGLTYTRNTWALKTELVGYADQDNISAYNDETETPGYWLANFAFTWNPRTSLRAEARVDNVLDESYQDHVTGINRARGSDMPVGLRLFGAERTFSLGLIYSF
jgi:iron complex outermembrane receptor protein